MTDGDSSNVARRALLLRSRVDRFGHGLERPAIAIEQRIKDRGHGLLATARSGLWIVSLFGGVELASSTVASSFGKSLVRYVGTAHHGFGLGALGPSTRDALHAWSSASQPFRSTVLSGATVAVLAALAATIRSLALVAVIAIVALKVRAKLTQQHAPNEPSTVEQGAAHWMAGVAITCAMAVATVSVVALGAQLVCLARAATWLGTLAHLLLLIRSALLGLVVLLLIPAVRLSSRGGSITDRLRRGPAALRVLLALNVLFIVLLFAGDIGIQSEEAVRIWRDNLLAAGAAIGALVVSMAVTRIVGAKLLEAQSVVKQSSPNIVWLVSGVVASVVGWRLGWSGATVLAIISLLVFVVSALVHVPNTPSPATAPTVLVARLPVSLSLVPPLAIALVNLRIAAVETVDRHAGPAMTHVLLAAALLAIAVVSVRIPVGDVSTGRRFAVLVAVTIALWSVFVVVASNPVTVRRVGLLGPFIGFMAALTVLLGAVSWLAERFQPPAALRLLGFHRVPVIGLCMLVFIGGGFLARNGPQHSVRFVAPTIAATKAPVRGFSANEAVQRFVAHLRPGTNSELAVPMVFVSASGGGIRAAAWTSIVLDCVFFSNDAACPQLPFDAFFAGGGASGGSIGLASVLAEADQRNTDQPDRDSNWIRTRLMADHVAASVSWQLFAETPAAFVRSTLSEDRSAKLERSWQEGWRGAGDGGSTRFFDRYRTLTARWQPLLSFNSTNTPDGCRVNVGPVQLAIPESVRLGLPADRTGVLGPCTPPLRDSLEPTASESTHDLAPILCNNTDVRLSTAAFLSARFPFVSPAARVATCDPNDANTTLRLVDGGYRENSGAAPLADLLENAMPALADASRRSHCIKPIVIEIENGYATSFGKPSPTGSLFESLRPLQAALGSFSTETSQAPLRLRHAALAAGVVAAQNGCAATAVRPEFFHFRLVDDPGARAPLGWSMSTSSLNDLRRQMTFPANSAAMQRMRALRATVDTTRWAARP